MEKINIYDAKTNLSKLINAVTTTGEPFLIAKNGKALVKVIPYIEEQPKRKLGFLAGKASCPDNFDDEDKAVINLFDAKDEDDLFT